MAKKAFIFPGQGSQQVGMALSLCDSYPVAKAVLQEVDDAISQNLSRIMFEGPIETLTLTENAQPALMAASLAVVRVIEDQLGKKLYECAAMVAGHSLGEYSALCAAGVLSLSDTAKLLKLRGQAMQAAVPAGKGAMAAIIGLDLAAVESLVAACAETEVLAIANDNGGGQLVISGAASAVERAMIAAKAAGAKRALPLAVSAPFHCALMQPAADKMAGALENTVFAPSPIPIIANVTATLQQDSARMRDLLVEQVCGRVRWAESVETMAANEIGEAYELGTGKVLAGLVKRISPAIQAVSAGDPASLEPVLKALA
ncbi:MAG: ACP S-malonyltransferase [Alphaproteobacteria bacterium]